MKILIATQNVDKFNIISKMIKSSINSDIEIKSLNDIEPIKEEIEEGTNLERAKKKAENAKKYVKEDFDAIIGIDDGVIIKDQEYAAVKDHLKDIISGDKIKIGEKIYITRAYYMITKENEISSCLNKIPYYLRKKLKNYENIGYPLNKVLSTIDNETVLSERDKDELNEYFIKHSIEDIRDLLNIIDRGNK